MKSTLGWAIVIVAAAGIASGLWMKRGAKDKPDADAAEAAPVAQVHAEVARERALVERLSAFGEVSSGPLTGLSFARAGQVTRLAVVAGDVLPKGSLLATLAPDPASREAYDQARNAAALARRESDRLHQLLGLQLATQSQVDAADKAALDAGGNVKALDAQGAGSALSTLTAPFSGMVASTAVAQGDRVQAGAPILQLARADLLRVQIGIEPADARRVHAGTKVSLVPVVASSADAPAIDAVVSGLQDSVDPKTQLVSAIVVLPRAMAGTLVPGMKVRAGLQVGSQTSVAVPRDAVLSDEQGDYVYQVAAGKAHRVHVTRRLESDGLVGISGLTDLKLPVVTVGNYELQDGMAVKESRP